MWHLIFKKLRRKNTPQKSTFTQNLPVPLETRQLSKSLANNQRIIKHVLSNSIDVGYREFVMGEDKIPALIIFIHGLTEEKTLNTNVMKSLLELRKSSRELTKPRALFEDIKNMFLENGTVQEVITLGEIIETVLTGDSILIIDGTPKALKIGTSGPKARPVSEPVTEGVVRGPREGFTEDIRTNTSLLRRKIKSADLKLEQYILGRTTKTEINIAYLENIVNVKVLKELRKRLSGIDVDSILESAYVEELIEDEPFTLFPQIDHSERPDKIAASIIEGRIAIFIDGTPFVLVVPSVFIQFFQSSEDYYDRYPFALMIRLVRYFFQAIALLLPAVYIAVLNFHHEFIPTALLISIAAAREGVPFPVLVEAFMMEITFEALREAGVRLPKPVGQAVSIVGALVIGESAVTAGIVSPTMVIVVALTAIASFTIPSYSLAFALRITRFIMMGLAAFLGFYGIMLGMLILNLHVISLRSFGVPYFLSLAPFNLKNFKDTIFRAPWWAMGERPSLIGQQNRRRQKFFLKPHKPVE